MAGSIYFSKWDFAESPPRQGEGEGGDGSSWIYAITHPHPNLPLEGEGVSRLARVGLWGRTFKVDQKPLMQFVTNTHLYAEPIL